MTSLWSRMHWIQKATAVLGILSFITVLSGIAIIQGLSLGWGIVGIGLVGAVTTLLIAWFTDGLEADKR